MWSKSKYVTVLALYPTSCGYSFALFDGPLSPFDWGTKDLPRTTRFQIVLDDLDSLIAQYHPDILAIEAFDADDFRRPAATRALYLAARNLAELRGVGVVTISKTHIRDTFERFGARTKSQIAVTIAREIAAFRHLVPPLRRAWMSESRRQGLYDAATLGLCYYASTE